MRKNLTAPNVLSLFERLGVAAPELYLVDVGVSGGMDAAWSQWKEDLHAVGVDALVKEIDRLREIESRANVRYEAALLGAPDHPRNDLEIPPGNYAVHRSSAYMGTVLHALGPTKAASIGTEEYLDLWRSVVAGELSPPPREANYNGVEDKNADPFWGFFQRLFEKSTGPQSVELSSRQVTLDDLLSTTKMNDVDFLKIDTDGYELDVLRGARDTLDRGCLMVEVEVQFHGLRGPLANVFANVDTLMRDAGFTLLKLESQNYGRSALPRPFEIPDLPAQTEGGPIQWADALYARDLLAIQENSPLTDRRKIQIMCCLLEIYELECMAAELVLIFPWAFEGVKDQMLDHLAARLSQLLPKNRFLNRLAARRGNSHPAYEKAVRSFCTASKGFR